jgi:UDP-GlcNAc:undecaprenyl-phosphate GlcNAc-1-phosphate transferase
METLLWTGARGLLFSLILTPICRDVFRSYRVVDQPGDARKLHKQPIPRVGGLAIALSYVLAYLVSRDQAGLFSELHSLVWRLLPAAATIFVVGLVDDLVGLKPWQKLAGQTVAALMAYFAGVRILHGVGLEWGEFWAFPLTIFWLLLCSNALNLVDGMDGLAAGVGLFATLTMFVSALIEKNQTLAVATLPLAACLVGFLFYNFNPATIFLGDGGSLLIGFLLGCYGAIWSQKSATVLGMIAPVMVLAIPLLDVSLCVVRRFLRNRPIFGADRGHIHHRLLDRGLHPRQVVLWIYAGCALAAGFSLLQRVVRTPEVSILLLVVFGATIWMGVQFLNYSEFRVARKLILGGEFQEVVNARLALQVHEQAVAAAETPEECWQAVASAARALGFTLLRARWQSVVREEVFEPAEPGEEPSGHPIGRPDAGWVARVPLPDGDFLELERKARSPESSYVVAPFLEMLQRELAAKLSAATPEAGHP